MRRVTDVFRCILLVPIEFREGRENTFLPEIFHLLGASVDQQGKVEHTSVFFLYSDQCSSCSDFQFCLSVPFPGEIPLL